MSDIQNGLPNQLASNNLDNVSKLSLLEAVSEFINIVEFINKPTTAQNQLQILKDIITRISTNMITAKDTILTSVNIGNLMRKEITKTDYYLLGKLLNEKPIYKKLLTLDPLQPKPAEYAQFRLDIEKTGIQIDVFD